MLERAWGVHDAASGVEAAMPRVAKVAIAGYQRMARHETRLIAAALAPQHVFASIGSLVLILRTCSFGRHSQVIVGLLRGHYFELVVCDRRSLNASDVLHALPPLSSNLASS